MTKENRTDTDADDRGFWRNFLDDYSSVLGIILLIVIFAVITDPASVGKWFGELVRGFNGK